MYSASVRPSRAAAQRRLRSRRHGSKRNRICAVQQAPRGREGGMMERPHNRPRDAARARAAAAARRSEEGAALEQPRRGVSRVVQAALRHGALRVALLLLLRVRVRVEGRVARRLAHASRRGRHARRDGGKLCRLRRHILRASRCSGGSASAQDERTCAMPPIRARAEARPLHAARRGRSDGLMPLLAVRV